MTKRILLLAALGAALMSCRQEDAPLPVPPEPVRMIAEDADPVRVSYGEAVSELEAMLEAMEPGPKTKGAGRRIGKMEAVTAGMRTRSGNLPDTLLYVVDLEGGDGGYAVMSALRSMPSTLVIADQGQGDAGRLSRMISDTPTEADLADESAFADGLVADYVRSLIVPDSVPLSGEIELITPFPGGEYGMWKVTMQSGPLLEMKWSQGAPFNNKMENAENGKKRYAGCGTIAQAQILAYLAYPKSFVTTDGTIFTPDWKEFKTVCHYTNRSADIRESLQDSVATLCRILAQDNGTHWVGNTGYTSCEKIAMVQYGWLSSRELTGYDAGKVREYIERNKPCCIRAESTVSRGAHIFNLDGIKRYSRNVYKFTYRGRVLDNIETREYVHCNFGWHGDSDGWYEHAIFNTNKPVEREPVFDKGPWPKKTKTTYDDGFYFLQY